MEHHQQPPLSMSLETQMTHFPALAPEADDASAANASSNGGIINSLFGNFFRAVPSTNAAKAASSKPLSNDSSATELPLTECSTNTAAALNTEIALEEGPSTSSSTVSHNQQLSLNDSHDLKSGHIGTTSPINNHKKLSIRISSMFKGSSESVATVAANSPIHSSNGNIRRKSFVNSGLKSYKQSEFRRYWMPDATGRECYECYEKFNAFRRRHHCRLCGQIFCGRCSNRQVNGADLGYSGVLRLCNFCANQVETHINERGKQDIVTNEPAVNANSSPRQATSKENGEKDLSAPIMENVLKKADGEFSASTDFVNNANLNSTPFTSTGGLSPTFPCSENEHLERLFEENIERTLDCLLEREHLDPTLWRDLLLRLSRKVIDVVIGRVLRVPNALNVLDFVHIKKLQTSVRPFFEVIEGVAFTKTLAHTSMPFRLESVSLMLLAGNISYERVVEKLSSLDQIMLQEHEYLKIQVDRITSRRVSLLLVENSVANLAGDMLLAEGIGLVTNVKHRVLERVARATNSDIITSLDAQFLQPRIGFVPDFSQREFALLDGGKKKILVLNNCIGGLSVLIHGPSLKDLVAAKRILKFLLVNRYSSKLEIAFLAMFNSRPGRPSANSSKNWQFCKPEAENEAISENNDKDPLNDIVTFSEEKLITSLSQSDNESCENEKFDCALCDFNRNCEAWNDLNPSDFMRQLRASQLTNSPAIRFAPPFFETSKGRASPILPFFKSPLFRFLRADELDALKESDEKLRSELLYAVDSCKLTQADNENLRHYMLEENVSDPKILTDQGRWARFRVQSSFIFRRRYELNRLSEVKRTAELNEVLRRRRISGGKSGTNTSTDQLSPYNCQRISFLYCANAKKVTSNARSFCMGPYVLLRQFFFGQESGHKDTSLGVFLMNYCFNADYKCGSCERTMMDHLRRIVHRNARIEISTHSVSGKTSGNASTAALEELSMDDLPSSIPNMNCSSIICWRRCLKCLVNSCIIPLSDTVYHLSFAKFIDYLANSTYWISAFPTNNPAETCNHCTFHEHAHFFAHHNFIACFKVFPIRPLHVAFNPMVCRIKAENVLCSDLIEMNYDLNSTASEVFDRSLSFFKDFQIGPEDKPQPKIQLSPAAESLMVFVEQFKTTFRSHMGKFDPDGIFKRNKMVNSNDSYYIQSESCLVRCRYFLYSFIIKWNSTKLDSIFQIPPISANANGNAYDGNGPADENGATFQANGKALSSAASNNNSCYRRGGSSANLLSQRGVEFSAPDLSLSNCSSNSSLTSLVNLNSTNLSTLPENSSAGKFSRTNSTSTVASKSPNKAASRADFTLVENGNVLIFPAALTSSAQQINLSNSNSSKTLMPSISSQQNFHHSHSSTFPVQNAVPVELPIIVNPLPKNLHFELPMNNSTVLVRDLGDGKSSTPDIGSIIGYALASSEYEERKQIRGKLESDNSLWEFNFGSETRSKYSVKIYFAEEFETLRSELFGDGEERFIRSLSRSTPWHPQGGKSGANFFRTEDERFVVKQMLRLELESFKKFGPSYFKYIRRALDEKRMTALCKIYGVYGINVTGKNQQSLKIDVLVMEYLFYSKNVRQIWDLKGSLRNRYASTKTEAPVLLDENLVQDLWGNQLYIHPYSKAALKQAILNDCQFLVDQGIMDYSLLAGVCHEEDEVAIGIVDYVRTFTLDKKVESLVKNALPIAHSPTVVSPEQYSKRFFAAIEGYFAEAPDQWTHSDSTLLIQQHEQQQQQQHEQQDQ